MIGLACILVVVVVGRLGGYGSGWVFDHLYLGWEWCVGTGWLDGCAC